MATPTENWPKPWMLSLHKQAVEEGMIWVEPISEADAKSLRDRMYRIRRRSDKSMAAFIPPEFHLVMIGKWEPSGICEYCMGSGTSGPDQTCSVCNGLGNDTKAGRLPLIYNKRTDGKPLPSVRTATGEEVKQYLDKPQLAQPAPDIQDFDPTIKPEEIDGLVERLRKSARERNQ